MLDVTSVWCLSCVFLICSWFLLVLFIIELAINVVQISLKIFHYILIGTSFFLSERMQNLYAWTKYNRFNPKESLYYAYLSDKEKIQWMSKVKPYVLVIQNSLRSANFLQYLVKNYKLVSKRVLVEPNPKVSFQVSNSRWLVSLGWT